jgi:hypothetical protein
MTRTHGGPNGAGNLPAAEAGITEKETMEKVLIEKTSKPIKAKLLVGKLLVVGSIFALFAGATSIAGLMFVGAVVMISFAKAERWWQHD